MILPEAEPVTASQAIPDDACPPPRYVGASPVRARVRGNAVLLLRCRRVHAGGVRRAHEDAGGARVRGCARWRPGSPVMPIRLSTVGSNQ